jgi:nucleotide-binding universal stress UspA family protein
MLATVDVPFDEAAIGLAVDAAVESGQPLIIVNVVETAFLPSTLAGWDYVPRRGVEESLAVPTQLAVELGARVERLRVRCPHPVDALLQVVAERDPGMLVFGPDREKMKPRRYRKAARAIRERATCLVWLPD